MKITNRDQLKQAIIELEQKKAIQKSAITKQYHETIHSLSPMSLIKDGINQAMSSHNLIQTAAGLGVGLLSKNVLLKTAAPFISKFIGDAMDKKLLDGDQPLGKIKAYGTAIYRQLFRQKQHK